MNQFPGLEFKITDCIDTGFYPFDRRISVRYTLKFNIDEYQQNFADITHLDIISTVDAFNDSVYEIFSESVNV